MTRREIMTEKWDDTIRAIRRKHNAGCPLRTIARWLNENIDEYPIRTWKPGGKWDHKMVSRVVYPERAGQKSHANRAAERFAEYARQPLPF